jgi:Phosphomannomutase
MKQGTTSNDPYSILPADYTRAFKPADIRGTYPDEIDATVAYRVARAFVEEFRYKKVAVGYDMRESTPELREAFMAGARNSGATVIDVGLCRSPYLYFASGFLKLPGAMITASHSPAEYNGIKLVAPEAVPLTAETGLSAIQKRVKAGDFIDARWRGGLKKRGLRRQYRAYIMKHVDRKVSKGMHIIARHW